MASGFATGCIDLAARGPRKPGTCCLRLPVAEAAVVGPQRHPQAFKVAQVRGRSVKKVSVVARQGPQCPSGVLGLALGSGDALPLAPPASGGGHELGHALRPYLADSLWIPATFLVNLRG